MPLSGDARRSAMLRRVGVRLLPLALLLALFALLTVPLLVRPHGGYDFDEQAYHLPTVRHIAAHWPSLDIAGDSLAAMAPGYHWLAAGLSRLVGANLVALRLLNFAVSAAGLVVLFLWLSARRPTAEAALLVAPLACSNFYVKSAAWLTTDNPGLVVMACALLATVSPVKGRKPAVLAALFAAAAVMTRQVYAWLALPMAARAVLGGKGVLLEPRWLAAALLPLLCLGWLVWSWGGLVPPLWEKAAVEPLALTGGAYLLSVVALFGVFYLRAGETPPDRARLLGIAVAALLGLVVALASPTNYAAAAGRWGGYLWSLAAVLPTLAQRSPLFMLMAPVGAVVLLLQFNAMRSAGERRAAALWAIALAGWAASTLPQRLVFQRYYEPTVLVFLIVAAGLSGAAPRGRAGKVALVALTVAQIAITLATTWRASFATPA